MVLNILTSLRLIVPWTLTGEKETRKKNSNEQQSGRKQHRWPAPCQFSLSGFRHAELTRGLPPTLGVLFYQKLLHFEISLVWSVCVGPIATLRRPMHVGVSLHFDKQAFHCGLLWQHQGHFSSQGVPLRKRVVLIQRVVRNRQALDGGHCRTGPRADEWGNGSRNHAIGAPVNSQTFPPTACFSQWCCLQHLGRRTRPAKVCTRGLCCPLMYKWNWELAGHETTLCRSALGSFKSWHGAPLEATHRKT